MITLAAATVPEIVSLYGVDRARVHAIPLAADPRFTDRPAASDDAVLHRCGLDDAPYVLFVGKLAPRRHMPEVIAGFGRAVETNHFPHRLVLAGPDPERLAIEARRGSVRHLGHVPDADCDLVRRADLRSRTCRRRRDRSSNV